MTVRTFRSRVDASGGPMLNLGRATGAARAAIGGLNGNVLGAVSGLAKLSAPVAIGGGLIVGLGLLAKKAVDARDALAVLRGEASLATEYERLGKNTSGLLATLGEILGLHKAAVNEAGTWSRIMGRINEYLKTDDMRKREDSFKKQTAALKEQKQWMDELAVLEKQRAQFIDGMWGKAQGIAKSLRTPAEIFADTVAELDSLFQHGMIGINLWRRGVSQAKDDLSEAARTAEESVKRFQAMAYTPVAAAERFTQSAASAVNAGRAEQQKLVEMARAAGERDKKRNAILDEGFRALKAKKPVVFTAGKF